MDRKEVSVGLLRRSGRGAREKKCFFYCRELIFRIAILGANSLLPNIILLVLPPLCLPTLVLWSNAVNTPWTIQISKLEIHSI